MVLMVLINYTWEMLTYLHVCRQYIAQLFSRISFVLCPIIFVSAVFNLKNSCDASKTGNYAFKFQTFKDTELCKYRYSLQFMCPNNEKQNLMDAYILERDMSLC